MATPHLQQLQHLQKLAGQLRYEATITKQAPDVPFDILSIRISDEDSEEEEHLDMVFYPENAGLDGSDFLQFFYQYPFHLSDDGIQEVMQILPSINNRMSLGHLSINFNEKKVQFKYVLALPLEAKIDELHFSDILDMCVHTPALFREVIQNLGTAQISLEDALILLNNIQ